VRLARVTIRCQEGHLYSPYLASDIRKKLDRDPHCSKCKVIKYGINYRTIIEEAGWTMEEEYCGNHTPIACVCPNGHSQFKNPSSFLTGSGCSKCSGVLQHSHSGVEQEFAKFGWKIIGRYRDTSTPMECVCPNGHTVKKSLDCLRISPGGCTVCSGQTPIHPLKRRIRRNERVKNVRVWRPLILGRDGYKCVICGSTDGINAHHLNSYHKSISERYDESNGVTLCGRHHGGPFNRIPGSFHMVFGCMNNTKEQFEEYRKIVTEGKVKV